MEAAGTSQMRSSEYYKAAKIVSAMLRYVAVQRAKADSQPVLGQASRRAAHFFSGCLDLPSSKAAYAVWYDLVYT